jgi:hypothetical protein
MLDWLHTSVCWHSCCSLSAYRLHLLPKVAWQVSIRRISRDHERPGFGSSLACLSVVSRELLESSDVRVIQDEATRHRIDPVQSGFLKLLFDESTLKPLGTQVIGEHASKLIHVALGAILSNQGLEFFPARFHSSIQGALYKETINDAILRKRASIGKLDLTLTA